MGDRPVEVNEKKSSRELERKIRSYLIPQKKNNMKFFWRKILAATKVKVNNNRYDISSITKTRKFHIVVVQKQQQRNVKNKCAACAKLFF